MLSNRRGVRKERSLDWSEEPSLHVRSRRGLARGSAGSAFWPIRERIGAGFAARGWRGAYLGRRVSTLQTGRSRTEGAWPPVSGVRLHGPAHGVGGARGPGRGERCQRRSRMRAVPRPPLPWGWAEPQPPVLVAAAAAGARAAASPPARRCFPGRRYAGERGSRRWRRHQGAQALLRVVRAPRGEGAPRGRGVGLGRPGLGAPVAPSPPQGGPRVLPARVREGGRRGGARRGALGLPAGRGGGPRRGQAGAGVQGPARWRPGEGARTGRVLRPGTPLTTFEWSWGSGRRGRGGLGVRTPVGACSEPTARLGLSCPWNFLGSLQSSAVSAACFSVLLDAAGGIPPPASLQHCREKLWLGPSVYLSLVIRLCRFFPLSFHPLTSPFPPPLAFLLEFYCQVHSFIQEIF